MEQLMLPLVRLENRYTICLRCDEDVDLADKATPEEDVATMRRHVCLKKLPLRCVRAERRT